MRTINFKSKGVSTTLIIAIIGVAVIVGASAYYTFVIAGEEGTEAKNPDTFIRDTIGEPETLDPAWAYDTASGEVIFNVYEPLVFYKGSSTDEFESRLATEWEVSDDGLTYRFKIREDIKFHNGNSLTPEDVEYSFERLMVLDRDGGPSWMLLEPLLGVKATRGEDGMKVTYEEIDESVEVDGNWVVLNLAKPYPPLMSILAQTWSSIIDKEWAVNNGCWPGTADTWKEYNNPEVSPIDDVMNGTGPFKLDRWEKGVQVVMESNDSYWRDAPELDYVRIKLVTEWSTRKSELIAGDADMVDVPRSHSPEVEGEEGIRVIKNLKSMQTNPAAFFTFDIIRCNFESRLTCVCKCLETSGPPDNYSCGK